MINISLRNKENILYSFNSMNYKEKWMDIIGRKYL